MATVRRAVAPLTRAGARMGHIEAWRDMGGVTSGWVNLARTSKADAQKWFQADRKAHPDAFIHVKRGSDDMVANVAYGVGATILVMFFAGLSDLMTGNNKKAE